MISRLTKSFGSHDVIYRAFWNTLLVMLLSDLASSAAVMIDGIILARMVGSYAIAAHGLTRPYACFLRVLGGIFATGTQVVCSGEIGRGDLKSANRIFSSSFRMMLILTTVSGILVAVFSRPLAILFGAGRDMETLCRPTSEYLFGLALGLPVTVGTMTLMPIVAMNGDKKRIAVATNVMMAVNIAGDLITVFFFGGSVLGMALATTFSSVCSFVILLLHFRKKPGIRFSGESLSLSGIKAVFQSGMLSSFARICTLIKTHLINLIFMTYAGTSVFAANSIVQSNVRVLLVSLATAIGQTALIMTGFLYSEEDRRSLRTVFRAVISLAAGPCLILSVIIFVLAPQIVSVFGAKEVTEHAATALRVFITGFPLIALKMFYINYFQASKNTDLSRISSVMGQLVFITATAFLFVRLFGTIGLWIAYPVSELLYLAFFGILCIRHCGHFPRSLDDLLFLPSNFDVPDADKLDVQIHSQDQVIDMSAQAMDFCRDRGISPEKSYYVALAVEELAVNIFEHGFSDGQNHFVDLKILHKEHVTKVRLRDDCRMFNPQEKAAVCSPDDPKKGIGLRMISSVSADPSQMNVSYVNIFSLNNLTIEVPDV